jgi:hypothetical protein
MSHRVFLMVTSLTDTGVKQTPFHMRSKFSSNNGLGACFIVNCRIKKALQFSYIQLCYIA